MNRRYFPRPETRTPVRSICLIALLLLVPAFTARAVESAPATSSRATVALVSQADSYRPGQDLHLGLRFRIALGWHIYWQNPGDAGTPPEIAWVLPKGARAGNIQWPTPVREAEGPVVAYAYSGELVLPVTIAPPSGDGPFSVHADAKWLVCEKICVPEEGHFDLTLPSGNAAPSAAAPLFAAADARRPQPSRFAAHILPDARLVLTGEGLSAATVQDAWFFPTSWGPIDQNAPQPIEHGENGLTLRLKPGAQFAPDQTLAGVLVLRDPNGGESYLSLTATPGTAGPAGSIGIGFARALLLALAGGLILNLMPCVFPVLTMKALAIARLGGYERRAVRREALSYTAGVLVMFLALGGILLELRATGVAAGWGFQFQSPMFVAVMAWLLFGIGLNLSGLFAIGGWQAGLGQGLTSRGGHLGSFFTGLLAAVVATPCTAPFMGSAIAAAVASPPATALGIFAALGLGLALPSVLLAAAPQLARLLPRPGIWMDVLRQALAFPMYAGAIWLLWVASQQAGPTGVLVVASGMGLLGFGAWALGRAQHAEGWARRAGQAIAVLCGIAVLAVLPGLDAATPEPSPAAAGGNSEPFTTTRLATLRAEGRAVFVDMTAAWCITCLVNEQLALTPRVVQEAFAAHNVAYLKGDWTRQDADITAFLHAAGRDGVPLYVYYPSRGEPVVLPQILTPALVLAKLQSSQS